MVGGRGQKLRKFADVLNGWSLVINLFLCSYEIQNCGYFTQRSSQIFEGSDSNMADEKK